MGELRRFKWGIGRLLMESSVTPLVIPIFIKGVSSLLSSFWITELIREVSRVRSSDA
jgi:hypothetical protein